MVTIAKRIVSKKVWELPKKQMEDVAGMDNFEFVEEDVCFSPNGNIKWTDFSAGNIHLSLNESLEWQNFSAKEVTFTLAKKKGNYRTIILKEGEMDTLKIENPEKLGDKYSIIIKIKNCEVDEIILSKNIASDIKIKGGSSKKITIEDCDSEEISINQEIEELKIKDIDSPDLYFEISYSKNIKIEEINVRRLKIFGNDTEKLEMEKVDCGELSLSLSKLKECKIEKSSFDRFFFNFNRNSRYGTFTNLENVSFYL